MSDVMQLIFFDYSGECLSVCLSVCLFVCLLAWLFVCLLVCLFVCLFVCLLNSHIILLLLELDLETINSTPFSPFLPVW